MLEIVSEMLTVGGHGVVAFTDPGRALAHGEADPAVTCVLTSLEVEPIGDGIDAPLKRADLASCAAERGGRIGWR